jgi:hypothetical protein
MMFLEAIRWLSPFGGRPTADAEVPTSVPTASSPTPSPIDTEGDGTDIGDLSGLTGAEPHEPSPNSLWPPLATEHHARKFLSVLLASGYGGRDLLHDDLKELYLKMCWLLDWKPRPWNPLAKEFRKLTTGDWKPYERVKFTDGMTRRVRVYPIVFRPEFTFDACALQQPDVDLRSAA